MPHIHEKIDFTAEVFVVFRNKVLLRKHDKYKIWLSVGGHIELDEDPNQAAVREVKEEVGLDISLAKYLKKINCDTDDHTELIPPSFLNIHRINAEHKHTGLIYFATTTTDKVTPESPSDEWRWATKEELQEMDLKPNIKLYAEEALKILGSD